MPKIIENARRQLLDEAKKQVCENGYAKTTIRSVAKACGLGLGTVYNYFESKDMLIATFMLDDWQVSLQAMQKAAGSDAQTTLRAVYDEVCVFSGKYHTLFADQSAAKVFAAAFAERHTMLRSQIAKVIRPVCETSSVRDKSFLADYIAESMLAWTTQGEAKPFEALYAVIQQLLK